METLLSIKFPTSWKRGDFLSVSRIVLHRLLAQGLDEIIHYDHRYESVEYLESGRVKVHFANGKSAEGDLLVAADGVNSAIRKQLLPESCQPQKPGIHGVAGKIFIDSPEMYEEIVPAKTKGGGIWVMNSNDGRGAIIAPQIYSADAKIQITKLFADVDGVTHETQLSPNATGEDLLLLGGAPKKRLIEDARDYMFWGYITKFPDFPGATSDSGSMKGVSQQDLFDVVIKKMEQQNWDRDLVEFY
jgi:hypothetical protein